MDLTINKLYSAMRSLPEPEHVPAKLRAHPSMVPWLTQTLRHKRNVMPVSFIGAEGLAGIPIEECADMQRTAVDVISAAGTIMETITMFD
jgi:hypothetical protein